MKFTKDTIASLKPSPDKDVFHWDDDLPGFGVRLRGNSVRWVVQYRVGAQQRRESLGDIRKVTIDTARKVAKVRFGDVAKDIDPVAERAKADVARAAANLTLGKLAEQYLEEKDGKVRPNTYRGAKLHLTGHWKPLANRRIDSIEKADVAARLREITRERGRTAAARARANLSAMFGWAMGEGLCDKNPVLDTNDPAAGIDPRDRVLSDHELSAVWRACEDDDFGRIVKLLILTGCRREEIGGLKWSEIDLDTGIMTIPGTRTKNHREHSLNLPTVAIDILRSAPERAGREFVFGNRGGSFSAWSYATAALHVRMITAEGKPLPGWVLHDLRRTFRTGLGKLGVAPHVAERAVNHVKGGIEAIYDHYKYEGEIERALALWANHVAAIVEERKSNVTALRRA